MYVCVCLFVCFWGEKEGAMDGGGGGVFHWFLVLLFLIGSMLMVFLIGLHGGSIFHRLYGDGVFG